MTAAAAASVGSIGFVATWARSMASSSGGTSLHGSLLDARGAAVRSRAVVAAILAGPAVRPVVARRTATTTWPPMRLARPAAAARSRPGTG